MADLDSVLADDLDAGKAAVARKDWREARRLLAPLVGQAPQGFAAFLLARTEFEAGRPDLAAPLLDAFQTRLPSHAGARVLRARIHLAQGKRAAARAEVEAALDLKPEHPAATRLLAEIAVADRVARMSRHVAVIDARHVEARVSGPSEDLLEAVKALKESPLARDWTKEPLQAKVAYFHHATDLESALRNYDAHLIEVSAQFDYITWPKRIQKFIRGKSVLDVGCGFGGFGMGFLIAGATEYVGLDPAMDLDSTRAKNKRIRQWADMGITPRAMGEALPAIQLLQGSSEDLSFDKKFDTIALHNVTEHLLQLDLVLEGLVPLCRPDSTLVYLHHNFYCWNGHHMAPNRPEQLDEGNPKHAEIYDWRHIDLAPGLPENHYFRTHLNQVRLDEIRAITEKHFDVVTWDEIPSSPETLARLTPAVLERIRRTLPDITERELATNVVFCVARPKAR
ncbi:MAG TPA: tetratricopeptide repeat protein [Nocardioidaceae bacterium]|nr:tetratricopeptide repeat protein [Nocardioidaceae bacterium]